MELYTFLKKIIGKFLLSEIFIFIKNFFIIIYKKLLCFNINMINLSLDELRLIKQNRKISHYENGSEQDLVKALSKPKIKIRINEKELEEVKKRF